MHEPDLKKYITGTGNTPLNDIQSIFRALVSWPGEDRLPGSTARERMAALMQCCEDLAADHSILTPATLAAILNGVELGKYGVSPKEGATYAFAAKATRSDVSPWLRRLKASESGG